MIIKCFVNKGFYIIIVGQVICAIGSPFLSNAQTKLANTWFAPNERIAAITLSIVAQSLGAAFGFKMVTFYITPADQANEEKFKYSMVSCLKGQALIGIILLILTVLLFKTKP